jgi:hypothetical protein
MPVSAIALAVAKELTNPDLILLVILLTGIMMFSAAMKKSGAKYFFVEQDDAGSYPDPFGEVGKSINYLKALKL